MSGSVDKSSRLISRGLMRMGRLLSNLGEAIGCGARIYQLRRWRADRGDQTLRLDYPLDSTAVVWDVGGYEGQWASDIFARFGPHIDIFEPMPAFAGELRRRFGRNPLVKVHEYAIGAVEGHEFMIQDGDASTLSIRDGGVKVVVRDVEAVWSELGQTQVDLLKLNIEGADYDLIECLVENGLIGRVLNLQVQFHDFVPDAKHRRERIVRALERTHRRVWNYDFVWESWRREGPP